MAHAYRLRGEDPDGVSVAEIRQQVADALAPYERTLPGQEIAIRRVAADGVSDRPEHLQAVYRFSDDRHDRADISAVAVGLLNSLPVAWGVVDYHRCPHDLNETAQGPCPDWTRKATVGDPPDRL